MLARSARPASVAHAQPNSVVASPLALIAFAGGAVLSRRIRLVTRAARLCASAGPAAGAAPAAALPPASLPRPARCCSAPDLPAHARRRVHRRWARPASRPARCGELFAAGTAVAGLARCSAGQHFAGSARACDSLASRGLRLAPLLPYCAAVLSLATLLGPARACSWACRRFCFSPAPNLGLAACASARAHLSSPRCRASHERDLLV